MAMRNVPGTTKASSDLQPIAPLPFLKWAGGKRKLAPIITGSFPLDFNPKINRFYEPFVGGGAISFALGSPTSRIYVPGKNLYLSDMNPDLITTYKVIRDDLERLIRELKHFEKLNDPESYYRIRSSDFSSEVKRAARFIFLNKTCFNGLWRVNNSGLFNVPYGRYKNPRILDAANLVRCQIRLRGAKIRNIDYSRAIRTARKGDLVYFDPPYIPISKTAAFSQYAKNNFGIEDQIQLAKLIEDLNVKGVHVILSNSDTELSRSIFGEVLKLRQIQVSRTISSKASTRNSVNEIIGTNFSIPSESMLNNYREIR